MAVKRNDCVLHLTGHHGDACPGSAVRVGTKDIEAFCAELRDTNYANYRPDIEVMPWGGRDLQVIDPFGNKLTFCADDA